MAWTLDLRDRIGATLLKADVKFEALTAKWVLNGPGSLEIDLNTGTDIGAGKIGESEWQLKRAGTVVWAGPWLGADVDAKRKRLRITAEGIWWWFRRRVVTSDLYYAGLSQHTIGWNLLNHTQSQTFGSLGVVNGTATGSTKLRNRYYCAAERPVIGEAVEAFTELDAGFDFELDPATRAFNTWTPARMASSGIALDGTKVDDVSYQQDMRGVTTFVTGIGSDDCGPILGEVSDTSLANTYGRLHEPVDASTEDEGEVTEEANEHLRANKRPRFDATVVFREGGTGAPAWASLVVGNTLTLADDRLYATYGPTTLRIVERSVSLDNGLPGQVMIALALTSAVD